MFERTSSPSLPSPPEPTLLVCPPPKNKPVASAFPLWSCRGVNAAGEMSLVISQVKVLKKKRTLCMRGSEGPGGKLRRPRNSPKFKQLGKAPN